MLATLETMAHEELNLPLLIYFTHQVHHEPALGTRVMVVKAGLGDGDGPALIDDILHLALFFF